MSGILKKSNSTIEIPLMEKLSILLTVAVLSSARCCEYSQNDDLVFVNGSHRCAQADFLPTESNRRVENVLDEFLPIDSWLLPLPGKTSECEIHLNGVFQQASRLELWALKMIDASTKVPSGILNGNLNQFGDFDQCLTSQGYFKDHLIRGKYCLANLEVKLTENQTNNKLKTLDSAIHSHRMLQNELEDQGHRIPKFETFNIGICIPASCKDQEIELILNNHLSRSSNGNRFGLRASINEEVCYVNGEKDFSTIRLTVQFMFLLLLLIILMSTFADKKNVSKDDSTISKIVTCFSLKKSWSALMKTNSSKDDIECIHGARFLNAVALLLSHKQIAMLFSPFVNRTDMTASFSGTWTMIGRSAILYTDSFVLFSGLLASYSLVKDLDIKKSMNFKDKLLSRLVRLIPNLAGTILFTTYVMDVMSSGPQWGLVVGKYTDLCRNYMWRNFLFIHNYFGFENMCLTHTHQLGTDMQLFLISPAFVFTIWKLPRLGFLLLFVVSAVSTWMRYHVTYTNNLSTLLYYGISVDQLWRTANSSYILPTHRLTVYLMGIFLGYYLRRGGRNLKLSFFQAVIGWFAAAAMGLAALFGFNQASFKEYVYNVNDAANFNGFAPVLWSAFISWGLLACANGYGGFLNDFLSWRYFRIFTKISYAFYLTQFPIFFYNVGVTRVPQHYKGFHSLFDVTEIGVICLASVILTLAFDIPFQELKRKLTSSSDGKNERNDNEEIQEQEKRKPKRRWHAF